jgi:hypothetical protein
MYWLLRMNTFTGRSNCTAVEHSWMFIRIEASPAISMTSDLGCAICAPMAAGRP